jgi:hypothetical protein
VATFVRWPVALLQGPNLLGRVPASVGLNPDFPGSFWTGPGSFCRTVSGSERGRFGYARPDSGTAKPGTGISLPALGAPNPGGVREPRRPGPPAPVLGPGGPELGLIYRWISATVFCSGRGWRQRDRGRRSIVVCPGSQINCLIEFRTNGSTLCV